ncbi:hypothetical protein IPJ72_06135 [Candidatus Peregrinibacteria bacterium]|nr:MAG: hypothetical protein IPJ72_06135 [Candidatus Peregrinibacteria bacterium]
MDTLFGLPFGSPSGSLYDSQSDSLFFGGGARQQSRRRGPVRGNDIEIVIQLSFNEAVFGTTKEVEVSRYVPCEHCKGMGNEPGSNMINCTTCGGTGQHVRIQRTPLGQIQTASVCETCRGEGKVPEKKCRECDGECRLLKHETIKIKVPAGIYDKASIRLSGKGEAGLKGGESGDLYAHVSIAPSNEFKRVNQDIHTTQSLHVLQAVLGDEITVKTIHGPVSLKIPPEPSMVRCLKLKKKAWCALERSSWATTTSPSPSIFPPSLAKKKRNSIRN